MENLLGNIFSKNKCCVAIDVGTASVNLAEIKMVSGIPTISMLYKLHTPPDVFTGDVNVKVLADVLKQMAAQCGLENKRVVSSIWGDKVITRHIEVPVMPAKELKKTVRWEAEKFIPVPLKDMIIEFVPLNNAKESGSGTIKQQLLLAAVASELVYKFHNAFEKAGITLEALDLQPFALWRLFSGDTAMPLLASAAAARDDVLAVADIGASTTHVVFIKRGFIKYTRALPTGGHALTEAVRRTLKVDPEVARRVKENAGLFPANGEATDGEGFKVEQIHNALYAGIRELVKELRLSLDFYGTREKESTVAKLILTGGESKLKGLAPFLSKELGIPVEPAIISDGKQTIDPSFSVAIGLALRKVIG